MYLRMAKRVLLETDKRLLLKFAYNFGWRGMRSVQRFKKGLKKGEYFPPFLYISVLNSCNLRCQGCWVDVAAKQEKIEAEQLHRLIREASEAGNSFFGILGGEPFMYKGLLDILAEHPDCYFQIFTNGQLITDEVAKKMRAMGNVTPLVSIEGFQIQGLLTLESSYPPWNFSPINESYPLQKLLSIDWGYSLLGFLSLG